MKKFIVFLLSIAILPIIGISVASAVPGECSAEDPCGTWAVVDKTGSVTNVIVCQASVCGSSGQLGGVLDGNKLVQQTPSISQGGQKTTEGQTVTEQNGTFTVTRDLPVAVEVENIAENNSQVVVSATRREVITFDVNSFSTPQISNNIPTEVKAEEVINNVVTKTETNIFLERKTQNEIEEELEAKNLTLLLSKVNTLIKLLGSCVK